MTVRVDSTDATLKRNSAIFLGGYASAQSWKIEEEESGREGTPAVNAPVGLTVRVMWTCWLRLRLCGPFQFPQGLIYGCPESLRVGLVVQSPCVGFRLLEVSLRGSRLAQLFVNMAEI